MWLTYNKLPLLGIVPQTVLSKKQSASMPVMLENELGLKIFTRKELLKSKLEDLEATTLVFNIKSEYSS